MPTSSGDNILEVFFSYSHKDEVLCDELNAHLAALKRQRVIKNWTDRRITESHSQPASEDYDALEAERENLLGAVDIAFDAQDWRTVIRMMDVINYDGVNGMLSVRGYWDEAKELGKQALTASRKLQDEEIIAR